MEPDGNVGMIRGMKVKDFKEITDRSRGIYKIYLSSIKNVGKMSTCNRLDLKTLGFWPDLSKYPPPIFKVFLLTYNPTSMAPCMVLKRRAMEAFDESMNEYAWWFMRGTVVEAWASGEARSIDRSGRRFLTRIEHLNLKSSWIALVTRGLEGHGGTWREIEEVGEAEINKVYSAVD